MWTQVVEKLAKRVIKILCINDRRKHFKLRNHVNICYYHYYYYYYYH